MSEYMTPNEVLAEHRGLISRNSLYRWLKSGRIPSAQPGGRRGKRYIRRDVLEAVMSGQPRPQRSHLAAWHRNRKEGVA